jgi:two-component system sensor histidine kinase VicK
MSNKQPDYTAVKILGFKWRIVFLVLGMLIFGTLLTILLTKVGLDVVISAVIGVVFSGAIGYIFAGVLSRPLEDIAEKTAQLLGGDFSGRLHYHSRDERGRIAEMYEELRSKLDENFSEMMTEKHKLETMLKQMADGMVAVESGGSIISANDAAMRMLHMTDYDRANKNFDSIMLRFTDDLTLAKIEESLSEGNHHARYSYGGFTYDARFDHFQDSLTGGNGVIMLIQDVTDRLKIDNMQADFVANVSHELKTPLTSIKGYSETLLEGSVDPKMARDFLVIINSEADRMARLVKDILQLSRLDAGQQKWVFEQVNLSEITQICMRKMAHLAGAKAQTIRPRFAPDVPIIVKADKDKIEQVILNILSNAVKYSLDKGLIDVSLRAEGGAALLTVADNGIGIPERDLPRVFERFFIVNKARSGESAGTGLGLSICKQIVSEHKGDISIASEPGKGTAVTVRLPLAGAGQS